MHRRTVKLLNTEGGIKRWRDRYTEGQFNRQTDGRDEYTQRIKRKMNRRTKRGRL